MHECYFKRFNFNVQSSSLPSTTFAVKPGSTGTPDDLNLMLLVMALKDGNAISSTYKKQLLILLQSPTESLQLI